MDKENTMSINHSLKVPEEPEADYERRPLVNPESRDTLATDTEVYARRWYILFVFCFTSFNGAMLWNTWGPITQSAKAVFGWDDGNIGMLVNYGNIVFIIFVLPMCWFTDVKGLRWATIVTSLVNVAGAGIRCISLKPVVATWMANICAASTGISGCVCYAAPSLVSSVWFPPNQRATATAAMSLATYVGLGMSFIVGPLIVKSPVTWNQTKNHSHLGDKQALYIYSVSTDDDSNKNVTNIPELKENIRNLMYLHLGLCVFCFLLNLAYFPKKPPKPPSISASCERTDYVKGLGQLLRMGSVWLIVLAFSLPVGVLSVWATVLDVNLHPLGIDQTTAGYMGFWQTMAGCAGGMVISRFSDIFIRRMKLFLIVLYVGATITCAWLTVLCEHYIPLNIPSLYVACILVGIFVNGSIPLFYEISCEASYPVAEGAAVGWLTLVSNISGSVFLVILLFKSLGTSWMNWALMGSIVVALPLLCAFQEKYRRMDLDLSITVTV